MFSFIRNRNLLSNSYLHSYTTSTTSSRKVSLTRTFSSYRSRTTLKSTSQTFYVNSSQQANVQASVQTQTQLTASFSTKGKSNNKKKKQKFRLWTMMSGSNSNDIDDIDDIDIDVTDPPIAATGVPAATPAAAESGVSVVLSDEEQAKKKEETEKELLEVG
jgi:hypothetical protein